MMACPVVHANGPKEGKWRIGSGSSSSSEHQQLLARYKNEINRGCEIPLKLLNECQHKVASEGEGNCAKQAKCFLGCNNAFQRKSKMLMEECGDLLPEGFGCLLDRRFEACVQENENNVKLCEEKLRAFVQCAEKASQKK